MRVIAGEKRGFKLKAPKGRDTRPTEDRVKESLFNILGHIGENSLVLDLFAGSGSIGIEFLSRGAEKAYFIDSSAICIQTIRENLNHTGFLEKSQLIRGDSRKTIRFLARQGLKFDYIYIDPPYDEDLIMKSMEEIIARDILNDDGILILEHEKDLLLPGTAFGVKKTDERNYGSKVITFYTYKEEE